MVDAAGCAVKDPFSGHAHAVEGRKVERDIVVSGQGAGEGDGKGCAGAEADAGGDLGVNVDGEAVAGEAEGGEDGAQGKGDGGVGLVGVNV